jgi:hypothetical protein
MEWMFAFHATLRAALEVKRALAGRREIPDDLASALARAHGRDAGLDAAFVRGVARPPSGRLTLLVIERLEATFSADGDALREALLGG